MKHDRASGRLVLISNRGPYQLRPTRQGIRRERTIGGLVTSLLPVIERVGGTWIAWGEPAGRYAARSGQAPFTVRYIELTPEQVERYYLGMANNALWPLCHYFMGRVHYEDSEWQTYEQVNCKFAQAALDEASDNDLIWVHDYHLLDGLEATRRIRRVDKMICILMVSMSFDAGLVWQALRDGAQGYAAKEDLALGLISGIRGVFAGSYFFSPAVSRELSKHPSEGIQE